MSHKYKVKLEVLVTVVATAEIIVSAESTEEAMEIGPDQYKIQEDNYHEAIAAYNAEPSAPYPHRPFSWNVPTQDVESNLSYGDIEANSAKEE